MTQKSFGAWKWGERVVYPGCIRKLRTNGNYPSKVVVQENEKLFKRINITRSSYQRFKLQAEYQKHIARMKMISRVKSGTPLYTSNRKETFNAQRPKCLHNWIDKINIKSQVFKKPQYTSCDFVEMDSDNKGKLLDNINIRPMKGRVEHEQAGFANIKFFNTQYFSSKGKSTFK
eukprot:TRINITY_DN7853_c0_g1_i9.p1 TRINITY_DN7853_c0_g1~~TRINITY_DN7853_c0_g1_i9.p1  ORF type:complete len:174 (-),score=24.58 TRINITY_DN7853_c0_g1_i9:115-636(-)